MELTKKNISYGNLDTFNREIQKRYASKDSIPTQVSALENDAKYQTEEQVDAKVNAKISAVYKPSGSVAFADLPMLTEENLGLVVNVTTKFTTTEDFLEGEGKKYPAGTNVAVVKSGEEYKYDALSGFLDLTGYAETEKVESDISAAKAAAVEEADANTDQKLESYVKAEDLETATTEEILALFNKETADE